MFVREFHAITSDRDSRRDPHLWVHLPLELVNPLVSLCEIVQTRVKPSPVRSNVGTGVEEVVRYKSAHETLRHLRRWLLHLGGDRHLPNCGQSTRLQEGHDSHRHNDSDRHSEEISTLQGVARPRLNPLPPANPPWSLHTPTLNSAVLPALHVGLVDPEDRACGGDAGSAAQRPPRPDDRVAKDGALAHSPELSSWGELDMSATACDGDLVIDDLRAVAAREGHWGNCVRHAGVRRAGRGSITQLGVPGTRQDKQ